MHRRPHVAAVAALAGTGLLLLSACGSGGYHTSSASTSGSNAGSSSSGEGSTSTGPVSVGTTDVGKALVDPQGKTLYVFARDSVGHSACDAECLPYWPPVPGADAPHGSASMVAKFGTLERSGGVRQLTVNGYPVYTYVGDSAPGQANGQGTNLSGGLWWVVSPSGSWIKTTSPSGGATSSSRGAY